MLVVDDNPINHMIASRMLDSLGIQTVTAESGREALDRIAHTRFAAVLMDIEMPDMDGLETTSAIRALPAGAEVPVVGVSGNASVDDEARARAASMDGYMTKPIQRAVLAKVLSEALKPARAAAHS